MVNFLNTNKIIQFIPRSNNHIKSNKTIKFNMSCSFDFKSIRNFIFIKFKSGVYRAIIKLLSSFKSTVGILSRLNCRLSLLSSFSNNTICFMKNKLSSAFCFFMSSIEKNSLFIKTDKNCSSIITMYAKIVFENMYINSNVFEKYVLYSTSKEHMNISAITLANLSLFLTSERVNFNIKNNISPNFDLFATNRETNNSISIDNFLGTDISLEAKNYNNKIKLESYGNANAYMPFMLKHLYPKKIKDWYDITLEDVFYGTNIV